MPQPADNLGKLVSVHGISPAYLQRAVFIVILSFTFFLATMIVYYIRQNVLYFLLASAFLITYIFTLFGWVMQRRAVLQVFESGLKYKKQTARWEEIDDVNADGMISLSNGKRVTILRSLHDFEKILEIVRQKAGVME